MFCKYCGSEIEDNSKFCEKCGKKLDEAVASFPLAQPAQTRINTGLFKKSKDN